MKAVEILAREHREALTRMDPAQVRAVRRLYKAAADPDRKLEEALEHQLDCEARQTHPATGLTIPDWMLG